MEVILIACAAAFICGVLLTTLFIFGFCVAGTLRIDQISSDKDIYRIEIDNFDILSKRNMIVLTVDRDADLSQK